MNATAIRQELKGYIDALPEASLEAVRPILRSYTDGDDQPLVYETDLTAEEREWIAEGRREAAEHPDDFITLDDYLKKIGRA